MRLHSECLPHVGGPAEVLLEDCLDVGEVGVIPDQVTQVETVDHPEIDLGVTDVDHLEISWKILAENDRTTHNLACHHHHVTYVHLKRKRVNKHGQAARNKYGFRKFKRDVR